MTDASKTPDHSIPIYGRPLKTDGTLYNDRVGRVHGPMTMDGKRFKNQHGMAFYSHGNYKTFETSEFDLISEYTPPAKLKAFLAVEKDIPYAPAFSTLERAIAEHPDADCILEMHEVARHPVNKGDV